MKLFCDSSAFLKRYIQEDGSSEVIELCNSADEIGLSIITSVEMFSCLQRLVRESKLTQTIYSQIIARIFSELKDAEICELSSIVVAEASRQIELSPLRSLDAIQLANAIFWKPDLFITADKQQYTASKTAGMNSRLV